MLNPSIIPASWLLDMSERALWLIGRIFWWPVALLGGIVLLGMMCFVPLKWLYDWLWKIGKFKYQ
jgi:hypothetical protein